MKTPTSYTPINCNYYDLIEIAAMRRSEANIVYQNDSGDNVEVRTQIEDLWAKDGEEFMRMANGITIRLDQLVSLDGSDRPGACRIAK